MAGSAPLWEVTIFGGLTYFWYGASFEVLAEWGLERETEHALARPQDPEQDTWDMVSAVSLTRSVILGKAFTFSGPQFPYQLGASRNGDCIQFR